MSDEHVLPRQLANRGRPAPINEGVYGPIRGTRYGELLVEDLDPYSLADEGTYFLATNPTLGTGIAGIAATTAFDATKTLLHLMNISTSKRLYLDFVDLVVTAAGTNGTTTGFSMTADKGTTRYSSGGSTITPINPNLASSDTAEVSMKFGALTTTAASSAVRPLGDFQVRTVIKVVNDSYRFVFGRKGMAWRLAGASLDGTTSAKVTIPCPPVILGENDQFLLHDWAASQSAASSYQLRCGFWIR